jgi:hypothetical protein
VKAEDFTADAYTDCYERHITRLDEIRATRPFAYHALMANLLSSARYSHSPSLFICGTHTSTVASNLFLLQML